MTLAVSVSRRAESDLSNQYRWYLKNGGVGIAERFLNSFDATLRRLARMPLLGRLRHFRSPELAGTRSMPLEGSFRSHLIFYRASEKTLSIERVMHGARDLERRLVEDPEDSTSGSTSA